MAVAPFLRRRLAGCDQQRRMVNRSGGRAPDPDQDLVAHPGLFSDRLEVHRRTHENSDLVAPVSLPGRVSEALVLKGKGELILATRADRPMGAGDQIRLRILDQIPKGHSGLDPLGLPSPWSLLFVPFRHEIGTHAVAGQKLGVIEVPDHAVMGEILQEQGHPVQRIGADGEKDRVPVDLAPDLERVALGLDGDRLSFSASAVLCQLRLRGTDMKDFVARILPLRRINRPIDRRWPSLSCDERRVELDIG
jgi:hypothetical protein